MFCFFFLCMTGLFHGLWRYPCAWQCSLQAVSFDRRVHDGCLPLHWSKWAWRVYGWFSFFFLVQMTLNNRCSLNSSFTLLLLVESLVHDCSNLADNDMACSAHFVRKSHVQWLFEILSNLNHFQWICENKVSLKIFFSALLYLSKSSQTHRRTPYLKCWFHTHACLGTPSLKRW